MLIFEDLKVSNSNKLEVGLKDSSSLTCVKIFYIVLVDETLFGIDFYLFTMSN